MQRFDLRALDAATPLATAAVDIESAWRYVVHWARHPDPGSFFEKFTWFIRWLPDALLLFALFKLGYGGTILFRDGKPIGHIFYQRQWFRRRNEVHMFSIWVERQYRKRGYGNQLMRSFLLEMGERDYIKILRISAGGDDKGLHFWAKTVGGEYGLPYTVASCSRSGLGWLRIVR